MTRSEKSKIAGSETPENRVKWFALAGVGMVTIMGTIDATIVNISLHTLETHFSTSFATVQWIVLAYVLVLTSFLLGAARLGDMLNKKRLYLGGLLVFTLSSVLCALAPSIYWLIGFRALQGLGAAFTQALGFAIITQVFPAQERGKALGLLASMIAIGVASGPPLGGLIISTVGWHWVFMVNLPIGLVAFWFIWHFVGDLPAFQKNQRFDWAGGLILFVTLGGYALAMTLGQERGFSHPLVLGLLIAASILLVVFVLVENQMKQPMIELSMFRNLLFNLNLLMAFLVAVLMAGFFILPYYLELVKLESTLVVGLLMMVDPILMGLIAPIAGSLSDRFGPRIISIVGLIIITVGSLTLGLLDMDTSRLGFVLRMIPIGIGIGFFMSPNNSAVMGAVPKEKLGITSGLLTLARMLGQTTGLPLMGVLFTGHVLRASGWVAGNDISLAQPQALVAGIKGTFHTAAFFVGASIVVALIALAIDRRRNSAIQVVPQAAND